MWTTEFNLNIFWTDEKTHDISDDDLRIQAYRISKAFAEALQERPEKLFYFILGQYVEHNVAYGIVHPDLTPRPAYVAFAAVGRLLNAAEPIGRVDFGNDKLMGYVFRTEIDGAERETMVVWSEANPTTVAIPHVVKIYDYLGRKMPASEKVELSRPPIFLVLPRGGAKGLKIVAPPAKAKWLAGMACPVVLQLIGKGDEKKSAFQLDKTNELRLVAYNFGEKEARGKLNVEGATAAKTEIDLAPGVREEQTIKTDGAKTVTAKLDLDDFGHAIVSARTISSPPTKSGD